MYKGTSASAGIGIGKAVIVEEAELVITRRDIEDAEVEIQRFKGALDAVSYTHLDVYKRQV